MCVGCDVDVVTHCWWREARVTGKHVRLDEDPHRYTTGNRLCFRPTGPVSALRRSLMEQLHLNRHSWKVKFMAQVPVF